MNAYLREIISLVSSWPKTDLIDGKIALNAFYETRFRLYDHEKRGAMNPFSSVALHDTGENSSTSALYEVMANYAAKNIGTIFHLSLTEFMALPREYVNNLLMIADKHKQAEITNLDATKKALQSMNNTVAKNK